MRINHPLDERFPLDEWELDYEKKNYMACTYKKEEITYLNSMINSIIFHESIDGSYTLVGRLVNVEKGRLWVIFFDDDMRKKADSLIENNQDNKALVRYEDSKKFETHSIELIKNLDKKLPGHENFINLSQDLSYRYQIDEIERETFERTGNFTSNNENLKSVVTYEGGVLLQYLLIPGPMEINSLSLYPHPKKYDRNYIEVRKSQIKLEKLNGEELFIPIQIDDQQCIFKIRACGINQDNSSTSFYYALDNIMTESSGSYINDEQPDLSRQFKPNDLKKNTPVYRLAQDGIYEVIGYISGSDTMINCSKLPIFGFEVTWLIK